MANIDLSQFHEVFFEESFEGLETIESGLLKLDVNDPDAEIINTMFRAAHSIKGGAGTFGFHDISEFTHVVESMFDKARSDRTRVTDALVQLLLESVDFMKRMLVAAQSSEHVAEDEVAAFVARLDAFDIDAVDTGDAGAADKVAETSAEQPEQTPLPTDSGLTNWDIAIEPAPPMFEAGHDPYRLIRELGTLGDVQVTVDTSNLPEVDVFSPESCYLRWQVRLATDATHEAIAEVFEWVDDDEASITITTEDGGSEVSDHDASQAPATDEGSERGDKSAALTPGEAIASTAIPEATSIRVNTDRVDHLVNLVGELVITQSMLSRFKENMGEAEALELARGIEQLEENTRELQEHTMRIRMLPVDSVFQRLPRLVRDVSRSLEKDVELLISGNQTEVDKTVLEKISDPLTHLVRNSLDHGIETADVRAAAGKAEQGVIYVRAYHEGGSIIIEVEDDGRGLDRDKILAKAVEKGIVPADEELSDTQIDNLIFAAGFSTADVVSDVSGRGVGMDVVKNNIEQLNGHIHVSSVAGHGSKFTIRLPLTLSIIDGQLVRVGNDIFIIPLLSIKESTRITPEMYGEVAGGTEMYRIQGDYIRILRLDDVYGIPADYHDVGSAILVVVNAQEQYGILVDEVLGQQQVVVKSLETNFKLIPTVSGATILGDGTVAMILDIASLFRETYSSKIA